MRSANFYFCPDYGQRGARVVLLVGRWTPAMREHYGIARKAFFTRPAERNEPSVFEAPLGPQGHPWGVAFTPENVVKYESHFRSPEQLSTFQQSMVVEMHAAECEGAVAA